MDVPVGPRTHDTIVIGGGVAGLYTALLAAESGSVLVLAKERLSESNSSRAQGGIAVALRDGDTPRLHAEDTLAAGAGFSHPEVVRLLTEEAPRRITDLMQLGVPFDRLPGSDALAWGREGAHTRPRILHAGGDATGARILETLVAKAREHPRIEIEESQTAVSIVLEGGVARGVRYIPSRNGAPDGAAEGHIGSTYAVAGQPAYVDEAGGATRKAPPDRAASSPRLARGRFVVLATGGAGQLFARTTNPAVATGDGLLLAYECGAALSDLELYQFHPTALALPGAPPFLLSEAMRGEGGLLRNAAGERFVRKYHPDAELAPRDVVARAIVSELAATGEPAAFLDVTHLPADQVRARFPTIDRVCRKFGLDVTSDPIPVTPAAHYFMGGVWTNASGQTTVPGLFAGGEVACTGVHGANRLASNSLLEALVFGARTAQAIRRLPAWPARGSWETADPARSFVVEPGAPEPFALRGPDPRDVPTLAREAIQELAWQHLGPERSRAGLEAALRALATDSRADGAASGSLPAVGASPPLPANRAEAERRALALLALLAARAALTREESRGAHFRTDFPEPRPEWRRHVVVTAAERGDPDHKLHSR